MALKKILTFILKLIPPLLCVGYIVWSGWKGIIGIMIGSSLLMYLVITKNPTVTVMIASMEVANETDKIIETQTNFKIKK